MTTGKRILQIVPHVPGTLDGVGDHALRLAEALFDEDDMRTTFLVAASTSVQEKDGFEILSGFSNESFESVAPSMHHVILHYSNYGLGHRGMPFELRRFAQRLRRSLPGKWITMFHELYASGPPWRSAFWTRPFQVKIARDLMDLSDACFVSNRVIGDEIRRYDSGKPVHQVAIMSNLGEPHLTEFASRSPGCWAVCGGTKLLQRSLRTFLERKHAIPEAFRPERLYAIGGRRDARIEDLLRENTEMPVSYHPEVSAEAASEILEQCRFGWLDYYGAGKVWPGLIFKSATVGAYCAHGVIPVFAHEEGKIIFEGDSFPGPFGVSGGNPRFPQPGEVAKIAAEIYAWYQKHASSHHTAEVYAKALA